jgi:hypothetical protein
MERVVIAGSEEVPWDGVAWVEGEHGDNSGGVEEQAKVDGGGEVVEVDGAISATGGREVTQRSGPVWVG